MKDLGPLQYFLGLEVQQCPKSTLLHQLKYTQELLSLAGLQDCNLLSDPSMYRQLVDSLNYLTITRPNISFIVQQVNQFMQAPC
jgi:hypothetical protein